MKYETVIFDLDGTLLDTLDDLTGAVNHALARYGLPLRTREQVRPLLGYGVRNLIRCSMPEGSDDALFEKVLGEYMPYYAAHCQEKTAPYEGIRGLLEELCARGICTAVVSNKPDGAAKTLCRHHFGDSLALAVGHFEGVERKPAPDLVTFAMRELGCDASRTVYVGDTEVDFQTARNAGIDCIGVTWGFRDREELEAGGFSPLADTAGALRALLLP